MKWDLRSLLIGLFFMACSVICIGSLVQGVKGSYLYAGILLFTVVGLGFLKKAKR